MSRMRTLSTLVLVGGTLAVSPSLHVVHVDAAGPGTTQQAVIPPPASPPRVVLDPQRGLLDQYCVTCHNERLKTAGLMLDTVNLRDVGAHAEVWEKVVRKLR